MADNKPPAGYSVVAGDDDGGRSSSGLIRRRIADEGGSGSGSGSGSGLLDLSLGSIYNNSPSSAVAPEDAGFFSPDASASAVPFVAAATAAYASPASRAYSTFPLGFAASAAVPGVVGDGNGAGGGHHVLVRASKALPAVANPVPLFPLLFATDGTGAAVPVPVHGNAAVAAPPPPPPPPNNKKSSPRGRRRGGTATTTTGRRRIGAGGGAGGAIATNDDDETAPPPFPWATNTAGAHPTLAELTARGIVTVEGEVRCKRCDAGTTISYSIGAKFADLSAFILRNGEAMHDRAPPEWMSPALPDCGACGQRGSLRPVIAGEKGRINWLFLLLGQTLGLCTLEQLKHFCARTRQHRTGAKDRVLYSTYMELCNQLCPGGPFDMASERKNRTRPFA